MRGTNVAIISLLGIPPGKPFLVKFPGKLAVPKWECSNAAAGSADVEKKVQTKEFTPVDPMLIRNVALVGHSHSGKSALAEWMLFDEKILTKRPQAGESVLDFDPAESARHSSIFSHFLRVQHADKYLFEVTDTPWGDFQSDAAAATNGCDSAVIVASASDGVQAGTLSSFNYCKENGIKMILALSKMDRPFLNDNIINDFQSCLGTKPVPLQVAIKDGNTFKGVKPLFTINSDGDIEKNDVGGTEEAWMELEESVAMTNDDLLMEYLDNGSLSPEKVFDGLCNAIRQTKILPLVYTSAEQDLGVMELMDTVAAFLPNPVEAREDALQAACESEGGKCGMQPGVEAGFAARVIHTTVDSFGSLSILRVISNSCDAAGKFDSIPHNVVNLRDGESFKIGLTAFTLQGKERVALPNGLPVLPGNIIAVPKLPAQTNDILTVPEAVSEEKSEIAIEEATNVLTPLSRSTEGVPLMFSALVSISEAGGKKGGGKGRGSHSGDDKLISALAAISREDTAVVLEQNQGLLLLHCMSADHAQLVAVRVKDRYGIEIELSSPPVQYKETISKAIKNVEGRHKKQSGGSGQFGVCVVDIEPLEEGSGVEFESRIKGGVISKPFVSSVEKGVREQLQAGGPTAGYPVTDVRVILTDGKMHSVDSNDFAFTSAGRVAVKNALSKSGTCLLQPMERVIFAIEESMQGEISSIVSRNDGYVTGSGGEGADHMVEIEAFLPSASIPAVANSLRAKTGGSGTFTSSVSHYQVVIDEQMVKAVVEQSPHRHE